MDEDETRTLADLPDGEQLTLEQAARLAGYASSSTLRLAMRAGRLEVTKLSPRVIYTTAGALRAYLAAQRTWGYKRGVPRDDEGRWEPRRRPTKEETP